jgi:hypothetical protein
MNETEENLYRIAYRASVGRNPCPLIVATPANAAERKLLVERALEEAGF